jgi:RNA polymerase sigma-70 factor (ECF subfamily)
MTPVEVLIVGDEQAELLRALHDQYAPGLFRFVARLTNDRQWAEDVVQETLFRAWRSTGILKRRTQPAAGGWAAGAPDRNDLGEADDRNDSDQNDNDQNDLADPDGRGDSVQAWLYTVARNLVIDEWRSARSRNEIGTATLPERAKADHTDQVLQKWLVSDALSELSHEHREVLVHSYYGGKSVAEIGAELGIPDGTVKSRLHYALRALRLALQEKGVTR